MAHLCPKEGTDQATELYSHDIRQHKRTVTEKDSNKTAEKEWEHFNSSFTFPLTDQQNNVLFR